MDIRSKSWLDLEPLTIEYGNIEYFEDFYERIKLKPEFSHIPKKVFKQWLWTHHDKEESIANYGWLNYETIEFELCSWSSEKLTDIYVIEPYREYYENRASYDDLSDFCCTKRDLKQWKKEGTWNTPPIILDINSLSEAIPDWCELVAPYQLVEGHSRLGYLQSMFTIDKLGKEKGAKNHEIYLMKFRTTEG
ncbi:hypothetical protein ACHRV1_14045 [Flavobacterium aquidurense]|uniref:hypothetical protein n=1 Tax=Flavobacterium aquidurense TaxID=362413 RepID=UPI003757411B